MKRRLYARGFFAFIFAAFAAAVFAQNLPAPPEKNLNFIIACDMGRRGESEQQNIANLMGEEAAQNKIRFVAVAGDPIHDEGVTSVSDKEWKLKFENIYTARSLQTIPWYVILGNHEYRGNTQAILDYSKKSRRWNAPSRYFAREEDAAGAQCLIVFLDTTPLVDKYYSGGKYGDDVLKQDKDAQLAWLDATLAASKARWKIVIGHHPVYAWTGTKDDVELLDMQKRVAPLLEKYRVNLYVCGHIHNFQHIKQKGSGVNYVVNSSASFSRNVEPINGTLFSNPDPGFSVVSVSPESILYAMVNHKGETIYQFTIR